MKSEEIVADLLAKGYTEEEIKASLNYEIEFPYYPTESDSEFEEYLNATYEDIVNKTNKLENSLAMELKVDRIMRSYLGKDSVK